MNRWDQKNILNATARDNLMTGASLGYSGTYVDVSLYGIGDSARWHSSTIETTYATHFLSININGSFFPQSSGNKYYGRPVRCVSNLAYRSGDATQSVPDALISGVRLSQA